MRELVIKGFIQNSLLDWDGKIVSTLYTPYCNFRCPYCQNSGLVLNPDQYDTVSWKTIEDFLVMHKGWIDGICLTGGEPCLFDDLPEFIQKVQNLGIMVKLDTNGSFPDMLAKVIEMSPQNYIAMDVKAPLVFVSYQKSAGIKNEKMLELVKRSIKIIVASKIDYEFRTTVVPTLHVEEDIEKIAVHIQGAQKYALQNFSSQGDLLNSEFNKIKPYSIEKLKKMQKLISSYVQECTIRGA